MQEPENSGNTICRQILSLKENLKNNQDFEAMKDSGVHYLDHLNKKNELQTNIFKDSDQDANSSQDVGIKLETVSSDIELQNKIDKSLTNSSDIAIDCPLNPEVDNSSDFDSSGNEEDDSEYYQGGEEIDELAIKYPSPAFYKRPYSSPCIGRLQFDIVDFYKDPPPGIFIAPEEEDIKTIFALIIGPKDTPYEGGFFYFQLNFPTTYPIDPPKARLLTTSQCRVRFNPNLYSSGYVCLSILGTWNGPAWSAVLGLSTVLISIQSLMNENPYHNEPGFGKEKHRGDCQKYNDCIRHETIRVAVCEMLEGTTADTRNMRESLKLEMQKAFPKYYDYYMRIVNENMNLSQKPLTDPFRNNHGEFKYDSLKTRLEALVAKYPNKDANQ